MKYGIPSMKLGRDVNLLLASVLVLHFASYLVIPILPVILRADKGLDATQIGIVIGVGSLATQAGCIIGGLLSDRIGRKITMVVGAVTEGLGIFGYGFVNSYIALLIFSIINGVGAGIYAPTVKAAIASLASKSADTGTTAFSLRGIAANIGISAAGLLIYLMSGLGSNISFYAAGIIFFILAILSWIFLPKDCGGDECPVIPPDSYLQIIKNRPFVIFSIASLATWLVYSLFSLLLPLRGEAVLANGRLVGSIWTVTSIIVIIAQGFISKYILQKVNPLTAIFAGVLFLGGGLFMIGLSYSFIFLTFSAVIFLVGEMLMLPTTDSLTSQLAHTELIGAYFSIANLISGLGTALGNFIGGRIINVYGVTGTMVPWIIFAAAAGAAALMIIFVRRLPIMNSALAEQETE